MILCHRMRTGLAATSKSQYTLLPEIPTKQAAFPQLGSGCCACSNSECLPCLPGACVDSTQVDAACLRCYKPPLTGNETCMRCRSQRCDVLQKHCLLLRPRWLSPVQNTFESGGLPTAVCVIGCMVAPSCTLYCCPTTHDIYVDRHPMDLMVPLLLVV